MRFWALTFLVIPSVTVGQVPPQPSLEGTRSWRCEFPSIASNDWTRDRPTPTLSTQDFSFHIDNVDVAEGTARFVGNVGSADLEVVRGYEALHFFERTPSGNLHVTTIFAASAGADRLKAMHSRHALILGDPLPSQAYGYCRPWE